MIDAKLWGTKVKLDLRSNCLIAETALHNRIRISSWIVERFDKGEFAAILAHEVAHVKFRHFFKRLLILPAWLALIAVAIRVAPPSASRLAIIFNILAFQALMISVSRMLVYRMETEADAFAISKVGATELADALNHLESVWKRRMRSVLKRVGRIQSCLLRLCLASTELFIPYADTKTRVRNAQKLLNKKWITGR